MATETKLRRVMTKYVADAGDHVYAANQVAKATELVSLGFEDQAEKASALKDRLAELVKGMAQQQLHAVATQAAEGITKLTGGLFNAQDAAIGMQVFGPAGAVIAGFGRAALEQVSKLGALHDKIEELEEHQKSQAAAAAFTAQAILNVNGAFLDQQKILADVNKDLSIYNQSVDDVVKGLSRLTEVAGNIPGLLATRGLGFDPWNQSGNQLRSQGIFDVKSLLTSIGGGASNTRSIGSALDPKPVDAWAEELKKLASAQAKQLTDELVDQLNRESLSDLRAQTRGLGLRGGLIPMGSAPYVPRFSLTEGTGRIGINEDIAAAIAGQRGIGDAAGADRQSLDQLTGGLFNAKGGAIGQKDNQSFLENTFGKLDEFNGYKTAFDGLAGAVTSGFDAMVDGTQSFGTAFKHAVADALKSAGAEMAVMALKETAYGFGALAVGSIPSAVSHFKSAGLFALGAAAAGVAAHGLGTSAGAGGGSSSSSAPQTYKSPSGGQGGGAQAAPIIVYGDSFYQDSPRGRARTARRVVQTVLGNTAVRPS